jgi:kinesin family protein C1
LSVDKPNPNLEELRETVRQEEAQAQVETELRETVRQGEEEKLKLKEQTIAIDQATKLVHTLRETIADQKQTIDGTKEELVESTAANQSLQTNVEDLNNQIGGNTMRIRCLEQKEACQQSTIEAQLKTIQDLHDQIKNLEETAAQSEQVRRQLHNQVQELRGNIRVFCRLRPPSDEQTTDQLPFAFPTKTIEQKGENITLNGDGRKNANKEFPFEFDRVFGPGASQEDVFEDVSQLVQSACDGYNVCVFAYGQTGSGKTHTMIGCEGEPGVFGRSVGQIFGAIESMKQWGWEFKVEVTYLEIYNEQIKDLLQGGDKDRKHDVKIVKGAKGAVEPLVEVSNLKVVTVDDEAEVQPLLMSAAKNRSVACTKMNSNSSRSHTVFRMKLIGANTESGEQRVSQVNLIDLAGSERLSSSGATGDRLKETQAINKSLSSLGDVIAAIGENSKHIPYRNSKLTYLLQNCLGGQSKVLMLCNLSPSETSQQESLCSLRFAEKVNSCQLGSARRNVKK